MGALTFLLSNWRYAVMGILALALGVQTLRLAWADESIATTRAAQEKAIADAQAKADSLANELIIAQASAMAVTEKTVTSYVDRIVNVPVQTACVASPAVAAGLDGMRAVLGGSQANPSAGATR